MYTVYVHSIFIYKQCVYIYIYIYVCLERERERERERSSFERLRRGRAFGDRPSAEHPVATSAP